MATEIAAGAATSTTTTTAAPSWWASSIKPFVAAHPMAIAVVGGVAVGVGAYYIMKMFMGKKEAPELAQPAQS